MGEKVVQKQKFNFLDIDHKRYACGSVSVKFTPSSYSLQCYIMLLTILMTITDIGRIRRARKLNITACTSSFPIYLFLCDDELLQEPEHRL